MTLDPGSVLLAGMLATVGGSAVLAGLPTGRGVRDIPWALAGRLSADPSGVFGAGVIVQVALGIAAAFAYVALWTGAGLEVGPAVGAAFGGVHWLLTEALLGPLGGRLGVSGRRAFGPRSEALPLLLSHLVYGTLLGLAYTPGS